MIITRYLPFLFLCSLVSDIAVAEGCYDTSVRSPTPYLNNGGEIIIMTDGTMWQDASYNYSYAYQYYPAVTLCPSAGFMIMNGKKIALVSVRGGTSNPIENPKQDSKSQSVIESRIEGEFTGWEGETVFKLSNGQIWQQSSYAYTYHYAYSPSVLIVKNGSGYIMQVEGVSGKITVRRLR